MSVEHNSLLAEPAERIYDERLRQALEQSHHGWYLAIEPASGDYYLGRTMSEAIQRSRQAHPDRPAYCRRIGYPVAVEL